MNIVQHIADLLKATDQSPKWHPEGNVFNHIAHVYTAVEECNSLTTKEKSILKWVAIFHDLGKIDTTKYNKKRGVYTAYGHDNQSVRYVEAFELMLEDYIQFEWVDSISWLVRNHMKPKFNLNDDTKKELKCEADVHSKLLGQNADMWHMLNTFSSYCDNMKRFCKTHTDQEQAASIRRFERVVDTFTREYDTLMNAEKTKHLVIMRGAPGAGKTTFAEQLMTDFTRISADDWFYDEFGNYNFNASSLGRAHVECRKRVYESMVKQEDIIVDNTFTSFWSMVPYYILADQHGYYVHSIVKENRHGGHSVHNPPKSTVRSMKDRLSRNIYP